MAKKIIGLLICISATVLFFKLFGDNRRIWDPEGYHVNSTWQKWSAKEILNAYPFQGDEYVLDIGSADGKVAALIATHVPRGHVFGIDVSPEMISFAKNTYTAPNIQFELVNVQGLDADNHFDLVTSFTTMHLIPNQDKAWENISRSLKSGGRVLMQFPIMDGFGSALNKTVRSDRWSSYFVNFSSGWHFFTPYEYSRIVSRAGLKPLQVDVTRLDETYASPEAFYEIHLLLAAALIPSPKKYKQIFFMILREIMWRNSLWTNKESCIITSTGWRCRPSKVNSF